MKDYPPTGVRSRLSSPRWLGCAVAIAAAAGLLLWLIPDRQPAEDAAQTELQPHSDTASAESLQAVSPAPPVVSGEPGKTGSGAPARSGESAATAERLPEVLAGTTPPEGPDTDEQGHLKVNYSLRVLLDYFFQLDGVEGVRPGLAYELALNHLQETLQQPALGEALSFLNQYKDYLDAYRGLETAPELAALKEEFDGHYRPDAIAAVSEFHTHKQRLQQEYFQPGQVDALFAEENQYDAFMLQQLQNSQGQQGTSALNEELQQARNQTLLLQRYESVMQQEGLQPGLGRWYQQVSSEFSAELTERFRQVENQRQSWETKKSQYLDRREQLMAQGGLALAEQHTQLDQIMRRDLGFTELEVRRMQALERRLPH